jgi:RNA polymerase sigma-70 factor (ECF subfamily)
MADVGAVGLSEEITVHTVPAADFAQWVRPHLRVMSYLAARLAGPAARDDVVQESLTRAWRRWDTYRPERGSPRAWLLAIVADRARQSRRARTAAKWRPVSGLAEMVEPDVDLERAIRGLPHRQRLSVELHYFVDMTVADVAAVMGCSEGTVKSALFEARARLRIILEER